MILRKYSATYCVIKASLNLDELVMWNIIVKVSRFLLPLLGFALIESCAKDMYGCPYADFEAKGKVSDEEGKGIQGIRVIISADSDGTDYSGTPLADTLWTDHKGEYITKPGFVTERFAYMDKLKLEFEDVDGAENGGEFQKVEIEVPVIQVEEGKGWYRGGYEAGADVTMIKK